LASFSFGFAPGRSLARRFGGRRFVGGLERHDARREGTTTVLVEVDQGMVLV
jgi:hypothetical protein